MGCIFVVRHGQDTDNLYGILNGHRDNSLTDYGILQTNKVVEKLRFLNIKEIYSSPLKRAKQTADIIADSLGITTVSIESKLIERDFGVLTGCRISDIPFFSKEILITDKVNYFLDVEDSETFPQLYERASDLLKSFSNINNNILFVTHGDIGKMLYASYYNIPWRDALMNTSYFENANIIELSQINT